MSAIEHIETSAAAEQPNPLSAIMEAIQAADLSYHDTFNLGMYLLNSVSKHVVPNTKWKTPALKAALLTGATGEPKKRGRPPKIPKEALDEIKDSGNAAAAAINEVKKPRGRPPMSEEEKAAKKAKRLAAKAATVATVTTTTIMENADMEELATELEKNLEEIVAPTATLLVEKPKKTLTPERLAAMKAGREAAAAAKRAAAMTTTE